MFGRAQAVAGGCAVAAFAGLWWLAGQWLGGPGDLRALLFLESLPLLLIPAGALSLPGVHTSAADWLLMLGLYVAARAAGFADALVQASTGWISGHTLMHLLLAAVALWPAYRAAASGARRSRAALPESTQRNTSLKTSS